jgi:heptaprenyl diphosphate synthase
VPTLAALYALNGTEPNDQRLRELLSRPLPDDAEHAEALAAIRLHPSLQEARSQAHEWSNSARDLLVTLPDVPARKALEALCDYVVNRTG